jgi:hypothetical protein
MVFHNSDQSLLLLKRLGIDPFEVHLPHRLLGLEDFCKQPTVIIEAAHRRLSRLRQLEHDISVQDRNRLIGAIQKARDVLLTSLNCYSDTASVKQPYRMRSGNSAMNSHE